MVMIRLLAICTLTTAASLLSPRPASAQRGETVTWMVDGDQRQAIVYAPMSKASGGRSPLVLSFHGHGDNMQNFQHTNVHEAWPEAVVVYFQGLPSRRDRLDGWQTEKGQDDDRDLRLVDVALASLRTRFQVDDARIYSTGFSNGANFTYLLWAERPGVFAAFAPVAARLRPSVKPVQQKPLFHVAGTQDAQISFADQQDAIAVARRVNGVAGKGAGASCGGGCTLYTSPGAQPVMTWIHSGGHEYPASTSERIAKFFKEHPGTPQQAAERRSRN
jgi:polyhydroxybutyrate depolymerase